MKLAVPYENGQIFPRLDQAREFKIYTVQDDEIVSSEILATPENVLANPSEELPAFLLSLDIAALLCGRMAVRTVVFFQKTPIQLLGGASGEADARVTDFLNGALHFDRGGACSGDCASCASAGACSLSAGQADGAGMDSEEDCDGNISACGVKCWE